MPQEPNKPGPDPAARERELIAAAQHDLSQLAADTIPIASPEDAAIAPPELAEDSFPGYRLLGEIHRGGQGVVYRALHLATRREVAIKVLREGPFAGRQDIARFAREAQVLAQLRHPHIVTIHDSGVAAGRFYIVMDYIPGRSLDEYVAEVKPSLERTVRLFGMICEAVHAAQLKGVIHRDLKPSNIRVDEAGEPHILDFGLAKLQHGDESETRPAREMSLTGQFIGSLPWASPEQAEGAPGKIDLRTDVYALGVILYQMLTGRFPYEVIGNMRDVLDNILRAAPARPSTVRRKINDEVETIVLKCLSKERERRYQSAGELAKDIAHYLKGEPIEAKRDSAMYVMGKWARRNKIKAGLVASFALMFTVASVSVWFSNRRLSLGNRRLAEANTVQAGALYANAIALATNDFESSNVAKMKERLKGCPPELRGWEWEYLNFLSDRSRMRIPTGGRPAASASVSPDGHLLAVHGRDATITILDADSGKEVRTLSLARGTDSVDNGDTSGDTEGEVRVSSTAFRPDGRELAAVASDGGVYAWALDGVGPARRIGRHPVACKAIAYSPDGQVLASSDEGAAIRLWDAQSGEERLVFNGHQMMANAVVFSPDGRRVVSGGVGAGMEGVKVWDATTGDIVLKLSTEMAAVLSLAYSSDGLLIAGGCHDGVIRTWDAETGRRNKTSFGHGAPLNSVAFSPDGARLVSAGQDSVTKVWNLGDGSLFSALHGLEGAVVAAEFRNDDELVVSGFDKQIRVFEPAAGQVPCPLGAHLGTVHALQFSPDGTWLMSGSADLTVHVRDVASGELRAALRGHEAQVYAAAISPDGRCIASGDQNGLLCYWDAGAGELLWTAAAHANRITSVSFGPDGASIATGSYDGTIRLWSASRGDELRVIDAHKDGVTSLRFSPDGRRIVSGGRDRTVRMWDAGDGRSLGVVLEHARPVEALAWSADGALLASCDFASLVIAKGDSAGSPANNGAAAEVHRLDTGALRLRTLAFSPDGRRLAAGGVNTITLWDTTTGQQTLALGATKGAVTALAFSVDGHRLAAGNGGGQVSLWETAPPEGGFVRRQSLQKARGVTSALFERFGFKDEVAAAIRADLRLTPLVREAALRMADNWGDDAEHLNRLAWRIARRPGLESCDYEEAVRRASAACDRQPANPSCWNTLGAALYRAGRFEEAHDALLTAYAAHIENGDDDGMAMDAVFLAMASRRLESAAEAAMFLTLLRELMNSPLLSTDETARALQAEAEQVVAGGDRHAAALP